MENICMDIFDFDDYKSFVNQKIAGMPKKGFGQSRRIAQFLNISAVIVSQVFKGDRDLTLEQAYKVTEYFGFNEIERDYFLLLVQRNRAGYFKLKKVFSDQINKMKKESKEVKSRLKNIELSDLDKGVFYSDWLYGAIRLGTNLKSLKTEDQLADHFGVPLKTVRSIVEFLLNHNICKIENGKLSPAVNNTHIPRKSPLVNGNHQNWRMQGLKNMELRREVDLFFTGSYAATAEVKERVKGRMLKLIQEVAADVSPAKEQELFCLNMDLFSF